MLRGGGAGGNNKTNKTRVYFTARLIKRFGDRKATRYPLDRWSIRTDSSNYLQIASIWRFSTLKSISTRCKNLKENSSRVDLFGECENPLTRPPEVTVYRTSVTCVWTFIINFTCVYYKRTPLKYVTRWLFPIEPCEFVFSVNLPPINRKIAVRDDFKRQRLMRKIANKLGWLPDVKT